MDTKNLSLIQKKLFSYLEKTSRYKDAIAYGKALCEKANEQKHPLEYIASTLKNNYHLDSACELIDADIYDITLTFFLTNIGKVEVTPYVDVFPDIPELECQAFSFNFDNGEVYCYHNKEIKISTIPNTEQICAEIEPSFTIPNAKQIFDEIEPNRYGFIKEGEKVWWEDPEGLTSDWFTITSINLDEGMEIDDDTIITLDNRIEVTPNEIRPGLTSYFVS